MAKKLGSTYTNTSVCTANFSMIYIHYLILYSFQNHNLV